jgi:hypothetical protein
MKLIISILVFITIASGLGQQPTLIEGQIVNENGKAVGNALIRHCGDTTYTDINGYFKVSYKDREKFHYYLEIEKEAYFPRFKAINIKPSPIEIDTPIIIRSRVGFWYDSKQIDSACLGLTIRQAIQKFRLDSNECHVIHEPPGIIRGFITELADSTTLFLFTSRILQFWNTTISPILDSVVIGIGLAFTDGRKKYIGTGFLWNGGASNPYYQKKKVKL